MPNIKEWFHDAQSQELMVLEGHYHKTFYREYTQKV